MDIKLLSQNNVHQGTQLTQQLLNAEPLPRSIISHQSDSHYIQQNIQQGTQSHIQQPSISEPITTNIDNIHNNSSINSNNMQVDDIKSESDNVQLAIPEFKHIFTTRIKILEYIPTSVQRIVIKAYTYLINQFSRSKSYVDLVQVSMFAKVVLAKFNRGGRANKKRNDNTIRYRCKEILKGNIIQLWYQQQQTRDELLKKKQLEINENNNNNQHPITTSSSALGNKVQHIIPMRTQKKMKKLISQGFVKKALGHLTSKGVAELTPDKLDLLKSKFPPGSASPNLNNNNKISEWETIDNELMDNTINGLRKDAAAGLSGLSNLHIQQLYDNRSGTNFKQSLKRFYLIFLNGQIPEEAVAWINGGRLIPLNKKKTDIRPIIIGDTMAKIAATIGKKAEYQCIMQSIGAYQVSEIKSGAEGMILSFRMCQRYIKNNFDYCLLQTDWKNCYNMVNQQKMLQLVHQKIPSLYPLIYQKYGASRNNLVTIEGYIIEFCEGLEQGSVLSNILLGLVQSDYLETVDNKCKQISANIKQEEKGRAAYVDDLFICNQIHHLNIMITIMINIGKEYGFYLNNTKSIITTGASKDMIINLLCETLQSFTINTLGNCSCLNIPFGSSDYIAQILKDKVSEIFDDITKIKSLDSTQIQYIIMKDYINLSRLIWWFRNISPVYTLKIAAHYDHLLKNISIFYVDLF